MHHHTYTSTEAMTTAYHYGIYIEMLLAYTIPPLTSNSTDLCSLQFENTQDTKTFPKCYVGRNGKRNQQKLHIQVCGSLKTQRNQGCQG